MSAVIAASGSPAARIISRSTLLRSCRMLPGQSCDCRTAIASSAMRRCGMPVVWRHLLHEESRSSSGISSRRSASGGTRTGTTASRWKRSSRKRPSAIAAARSRALEEMMRTSTSRGSMPPTRVEILIDQHAQDLALRFPRHIGDLVDDRACRHAPPRARRPCGCVPVRWLGAEQLHFHRLRRDRRRVDA